MRVMTANLNGIRSAERKGFFTWMLQQDVDIVCIQETKAHQSQLSAEGFTHEGYHAYFHNALRPGYSGTAIYTRIEPEQVHYGLGWPIADEEGRCVQVDFPELSVISLYMPSGSSSEIRQQVKFEFLRHYEPVLKKMRQQQREYIICGDWNIVHKEMDIKNFKANQKNSGCLPEERAWLDQLFGEWGFADAFRLVDQRADQYTWWSQRGQARARNVGWRIDYQVITPGLIKTVQSAQIFSEPRFSDHAPLIIDYAIEVKNASK